jgi:hypothetical protein
MCDEWNDVNREKRLAGAVGVRRGDFIDAALNLASDHSFAGSIGSTQMFANQTRPWSPWSRNGPGASGKPQSGTN